MKFCNKCEKDKKLSEFYSGRSNCKQCVKQYRKEYYSKNRNKCIVSMKKYEANNKEYLSVKAMHWYRKNKEIKLQYEKQYYTENKVKILERERKHNKNRYVEDLQYRLKCILRKRLRTAIKNNQKIGSAVRDLGCSIEDLKKHLESQFQSGMTWDNHGEWHIDHIKPLASFDLQDPTQLREACHYSNLQPLWAKDNLKKGATIN